jgi:hypothetical protein
MLSFEEFLRVYPEVAELPYEDQLKTYHSYTTDPSWELDTEPPEPW